MLCMIRTFLDTYLRLTTEDRLEYVRSSSLGSKSPFMSVSAVWMVVAELCRLLL